MTIRPTKAKSNKGLSCHIERSEISLLCRKLKFFTLFRMTIRPKRINKKSMKKNTKHSSKKATAKPSGRKKMAVKALKNDKKNKFIQEKFNSFQEMFPVLSYD